MLTLYELEARFARHNVNVCHIIQKIIAKKEVKYLLNSAKWGPMIDWFTKERVRNIMMGIHLLLY